MHPCHLPFHLPPRYHLTISTPGRHQSRNYCWHCLDRQPRGHFQYVAVRISELPLLSLVVRVRNLFLLQFSLFSWVWCSFFLFCGQGLFDLACSLCFCLDSGLTLFLFCGNTSFGESFRFGAFDKRDVIGVNNAKVVGSSQQLENKGIKVKENYV